MDIKKIGQFTKKLRKEKGLTQEQLAEILFVSARTVSRWETGANLPDLSILVRMSEFYGVDIKEILDGERRSENMDQEFKETLFKVADYNKKEREKAAAAGNYAFIAAFLVCTVSIVVQLIISGSLLSVLGETAALLVGGIVYLGIIIYHGAWESDNGYESTPLRDFMIDTLCTSVFTILLVIAYMRLGVETSQIVRIAVLFFVGIEIIGFVLLRVLAFLSRKRKKQKEMIPKDPPLAVFVANGTLEADMIINVLKDNGIPAYKQDLGDAGFASVRYGMGRGIDNRISIYVPQEKRDLALKLIEEIS